MPRDHRQRISVNNGRERGSLVLDGVDFFGLLYKHGRIALDRVVAFGRCLTARVARLGPVQARVRFNGAVLDDQEEAVRLDLTLHAILVRVGVDIDWHVIFEPGHCWDWHTSDLYLS